MGWEFRAAEEFNKRRLVVFHSLIFARHFKKPGLLTIGVRCGHQPLLEFVVDQILFAHKINEKHIFGSRFNGLRQTG
jgi:hypothetical protein